MAVACAGALTKIGSPIFPHSAYHPSFAPDGRQIVFTQGSSNDAPGGCGVANRLAVINVDGTGIRQLTTGDALDAHSAPSWSTRGILFQSYRCGAASSDIAMIQPDGTGLQALLNAPAASQPTWSRDGAEFAFVRAGDYAYNVSGYGIYEFNLSNSAIRALVQIRGYFISIEIMPGLSSKVISLKETPLIRVAIPKQGVFDPPKNRADLESVTFGRTGDEPSMSSCTVNGAEAVCLFRTDLTGLRPGDVQGILRIVTGTTSPTYKFRHEGRATVQIIP